MKKINAFILAVVIASLALVAGCYDNDVVYPETSEYMDFVNEGWACFQAGDIANAMVNFQIGIEMDVTRPEAYLGAAWSSIALSDYWDLTINYAYMATNLDGAEWGLETTSSSLTQDTLWTNFECIYPVLTATDMMVIASYGDSSLVIDGDTLVPFYPLNEEKDDILAVNNLIIGIWLDDAYGNIRFSYRFEIDESNVISIFEAINNFSPGHTANVDSIVNGSTSSMVYVSIPRRRVVVPGAHENYPTWIMFDNKLDFDYVTYTTPVGDSDISRNALAAFGILQDARAANGLGIEGAGALIGLTDDGNFSFDKLPNLTSTQLNGMAASIAYRNKAYRFALGICLDNGFAEGLLPADPGFLITLAQEIEMMLQ